MAASVKRPCQAVAVRYVPDVRTGEFLNIGVVLVSVDSVFARARFVSQWSRVKAAFPGADVRHLQHVARAIEQACAGWEGRSRQAGVASVGLQLLLRTAIHVDDASIQFSPTITGITADPLATLNELFAKYAGHLSEALLRVDVDIVRSFSDVTHFLQSVHDADFLSRVPAGNTISESYLPVVGHESEPLIFETEPQEVPHTREGKTLFFRPPVGAT